MGMRSVAARGTRTISMASWYSSAKIARTGLGCWMLKNESANPNLQIPMRSGMRAHLGRVVLRMDRPQPVNLVTRSMVDVEEVVHGHEPGEPSDRSGPAEVVAGELRSVPSQDELASRAEDHERQKASLRKRIQCVSFSHTLAGCRRRRDPGKDPNDHLQQAGEWRRRAHDHGQCSSRPECHT